jgi:hypothetical protein
MAAAKKEKTPDYIVEHDGFAVITLHSPAKIDGVKVTEITMREPTVGDDKRTSKFKGDESDRVTFGMSNLCEISPEDIDGLTLRNFNRLAEAFQLFTM